MDNPTPNDDSYWVKMDNGSFAQANGLTTSGGWQWGRITNYLLTAGEHTLTIAYRENGAKLDKICISNYVDPPVGMGDEAENICVPDTATPIIGIKDVTVGSDTYILNQNYPNPFNEKTNISFEIPKSTYVSIKVFSMLGEEIIELAGKEYSSGMHNLEFNATNLSKGIYFYTIKADKYFATRKMIIQGE